MSVTPLPREVRRHTRRTLYVVAGFYVAVGFVVATAAAVLGDRLGTFLGFLIISGAIVTAVILRALLRAETYLAALGELAATMHARLERVETATNALQRRVPPENGRSADGGVRLLDLTAIGGGDPSLLTAATLERKAFPRLVTSLEEEVIGSHESPASEDTAGLEASNTEPSLDAVPAAVATSETTEDSMSDFEEPGAPAVKSLFRLWKVALRRGDLAGCREVYAALVDAADPQTIAPLGAQLAAVADRVEASLRQAYGARVRDKDYAAALALGERIRCLLSDRPVADECRRLAPILARRLSDSAPQPLPVRDAQ